MKTKPKKPNPKTKKHNSYSQDTGTAAGKPFGFSCHHYIAKYKPLLPLGFSPSRLRFSRWARRQRDSPLG